jgi:Na+-transporting NADH:ubiquinone oxidoreductase subunit NqrC
MIAYYLVISANPEGFDSTYLAGLLIPIVAMCLLSSMLLPMVNYLGMSIQAQQEVLSRHDCNIVANPAKTIYAVWNNSSTVLYRDRET